MRSCGRDILRGMGVRTVGLIWLGLQAGCGDRSPPPLWPDPPPPVLAKPIGIELNVMGDSASAGLGGEAVLGLDRAAEAWPTSGGVEEDGMSGAETEGP